MTLGDRIVVMSNGLVQQVGPPLEVYRRPANRFVASFVGTPPMNFLDGTLEFRGTTLSFVDASRAIVLEVPPGGSDLRRSHAGKPVVLGLRPQSLREGDTAPGRTVVLTVHVVEPLGDTMDLFCSAPGHPRITARIPARAGVEPGKTMSFVCDMDQAHLFEPGEFGRALV